MAKQECVMLFPEVEGITKRLTDEQFGALIRAVIGYQLRAEEYTGDDPAVDMAFQFLSNQHDRAIAYREQKSQAARSRWDKQKAAEDMQSDAEECTPMQNDAPEEETGGGNPPPAPKKSTRKEKKAERKGYGSFGWVKLTEKEYARLVEELGETEVMRCINYVDESAQSTGNKNKWKDWNLVIRKCSREEWGLNRQYGRAQKVPTGASGKLGTAELDFIRKALEG